MLSRFPSVELYTNKRVIAIFFLGIASGLPLALLLSTLSVWLIENGVTKTTIGLFALLTTPYTLKFTWSPLIDQLPLPFFTKKWGRRRGWLIFIHICLASSIIGLGMSNPAENAYITAWWAFIVSIMAASNDIVVDAYRVEILEKRQQGAGSAMAVFGYRIGMLISGAGALLIAHYMGWFAAYSAVAALIFIGTITVLIVGEPETGVDIEVQDSKKPASKRIKAWFARAVAKPFTDFMARPGWALVLLFILLYKFGDAFAGIMTNPFLVETGFSKAEIATVVKTFGLFALLVGSFIGGLMVNKLGMMKSLWICGILQMLSNLMFVVQSYVGYNLEILAVTIAVENLSGGMGTTAFVAYIASLCNVRYTATQFALFSSLAAVGRTWLSASSGWFVDHLGWVDFFILSTLIAIPGLLMIIIIRRFEKNNQENLDLDENPTTNCNL